MIKFNLSFCTRVFVVFVCEHIQFFKLSILGCIPTFFIGHLVFGTMTLKEKEKCQNNPAVCIVDFLEAWFPIMSEPPTWDA
jgi:hypothetical protein